MKSQVVAAVLFGSMWHGYRRWMSFFNILSIVLSVMLATVITSFSLGVRRYIDDLVRKEAAAGAVRANYGDVFVVDDKMTFEQANHALSSQFSSGQYQGYNLWWRSESHQLMLNNPLDLKKGGVYSSLGNTFVGDPEAERVADFQVAGSWISDDASDEIVLTLNAARALLQQLPTLHAVEQLIGREVWLALPPTFDHDPAASARVRIVGIYDHLRDNACMTTAGIIQKMYSRILANANGTWQNTYDRMAYTVQAVEAGDRTPENGDRTSNLKLQTSNVKLQTPDLKLKTSAPAPLLCWRIRNLNERWIYLSPALQTALETASNSLPAATQQLVLTVQPDAAPSGTCSTTQGSLLTQLPTSPYSDLQAIQKTHPYGFALCSPRLWNELGFDAAPQVFNESWKAEAHYAYYYFNDLKTAREARSLMQRWGLATYMPIDQFSGLIALVNVVTAAAGALMLAILTAGTLGIVVTLYTEVDAGAAEIGLLKALGASNTLVGTVFLLKGAFIGLIGSIIGIPAGILLDGVLNKQLAGTVAEQAGLSNQTLALFYHNPWAMAAIAAGIILLASAAAITPSMMAAKRDPQEALREE